jgi:hypothetical protein
MVPGVGVLQPSAMAVLLLESCSGQPNRHQCPSWPEGALQGKELRASFAVGPRASSSQGKRRRPPPRHFATLEINIEDFK